MIKTFLFFDVETTNLIRGNIMPKIIELSLVAVTREAVCKNKHGLPRVLHKLILPVHPSEKISDKIESLTNLSNQGLKEVKPFQCEMYEVIMHFINRLAAPVCFVAHNGNKFDYPIFLWELKRINKVIHEDILCIDTLPMFKEFFNETVMREANTSVNATDTTSFNQEDISVLFNDGCDEVLSAALDAVMMKDTKKNSSVGSCQNFKNACVNHTHDESICISSQSDGMSISQINCNSTTSSPTNIPCTMQKFNEKTPEHQIIKLHNINGNFQNSNGKTVKRKLDFMNQKPPNFKLTTVYEYMLGTIPKNAHTAEGDCLNMLECVSQIGDYFIEWADKNAVQLINYSKA